MSLHDLDRDDDRRRPRPRWPTTRGAALLVVNTASQCGLTPQYAGLQELHEQFADRGFAVLGFPCNQFGAQEPGTEGEIKAFCESGFGVRFPMFAKVEVNGDGRHPLYAALTETAGRRRAGRRRALELREVPGLAVGRGAGPLPSPHRAARRGDRRGRRAGAAGVSDAGVRVERHAVVGQRGVVAELVLDRPEAMNALSTAMARGLADACAGLAADPEVVGSCS